MSKILKNGIIALGRVVLGEGGEAESVERGGRERGDGALKTHHISAASNTDISAAKVVVILQGLHDAPPHPDFFHLDTLKKF